MCVSVHLQQGCSPYLSSSECWARTCWAGPTAAKPCCKLVWQASGPEPPGGACGWGWDSAEGTCPAPCPCPCPGASTGGKGGWKAGEVCCFLPNVVLPLRRVWSECLLEGLHEDSRDRGTVGKKQITKPQIRWRQRITLTTEHGRMLLIRLPKKSIEHTEQIKWSKTLD